MTDGISATLVVGVYTDGKTDWKLNREPRQFSTVPVVGDDIQVGALDLTVRKRTFMEDGSLMLWVS